MVVGRIKEKYIKMGLDNFIKRLRSYCRFEVVELADGSSFKKIDKYKIEKAKEDEGEKILNHLRPDDYLVALDSGGEVTSSEGLASCLQTLLSAGRNKVVFVIGGPFGLDQRVLKRADHVLSLSQLTFTHEMVRLIFCEQLYRAYKILRKEPYHY